MVHDLGKLSIMDTILRKPESLTAEEFTIIKSHPVVGAKILEPLRFLAREICATTTSAGTAPAIPTASAARTSRWWRGW
jgi:hypothetical protein